VATHTGRSERGGFGSWSTTRWLVIGAIVLAVVVAVILVLTLTGGGGGGGGGTGGY
jgi:hypothetical protein